MVTFDNNLMKAQYICYGGVNPANGGNEIRTMGTWHYYEKVGVIKLNLNIPAQPQKYR
jgi:hypothetical protein